MDQKPTSPTGQNRWFWQLEASDASPERQLLNAVLFFVFSAALTLAATTPFFPQSYQPLSYVACGLTLVLTVALRVLAQRGNVRLASTLLLAGVWLMLTSPVVAFGGLYSPAYSGYTVIIVVAVLLLGVRSGIVFTLLSVLVGLGMAYAQRSGISASGAPDPLLVWVSLGAIFGVIVSLLGLADRQIQRSLAQTRQSAQLLAESNHQLTANEVQLRRANRAYGVLSACNQILVRASTETDLLHQICQALLDHGGYRLAAVGLVDAKAPASVLPAVHVSEQPLTVEMSRLFNAGESGPVAVALRTGTPQIMDDAQAAQVCPWGCTAEQHCQCSAMAVLPVPVDAGVLGVLVLCAKEEVFAAGEMPLLTELAGDLGYGLMALRREAARQHTTDLLTATLASMDQAVFLLEGPDRIIRTCNQAVASIFGYTPAEIIGKPVAFLHPDAAHYEQFLRKRTKVLAGQETFQTAYWTRHRDGHRLQLDVTVTPLLIEEGQEGEVSVVRDVSRQHRQAEELRRSEERYRSLFDAIQQGVVLYNVLYDEQGSPTDYRYLDVNSAFTEITGMAHASIVGQTARTLSPTFDQSLLQTFSEVALTGVPAHFDYHFAPWNRTFELTVFRPQVEQIAVAFAEVTARVQAQQALHDSEAYFRSLIENAQDIITVLDAEGTILYNSPALQPILGFPPADVVNRSIFDSVHPDDLARMQQIFAAITGTPAAMASFEVRLWHANGTWRTLAATVKNLLADPVVAGLVINSRDVTDRRQRERELQAIANASAALRSLNTQPQILTIVLGQVMELLSAQSGSVLMVDPAGGGNVVEMALGAATPLAGSRQAAGVGLSRQVICSGLPLVTDDARTDVRTFVPNESGPPHAVACVPLVAQEQTIGALCVGRDYVPFQSDDVRLLSAIADIAAAALENARLFGETRRLLQQTQEQARQMEQILGTVPNGILLLDAQLRVQLANPTALDLAAVLGGAAEGEVITSLGGITIAALLAPSPALPRHELKVAGPPERVFEIAARPVLAQEETLGWVVAIQEMTQERAMQALVQQQQQLAAIGQLAAGIAHDFNNILSVVVLYTQLLQKTPNLSQDIYRRLAIIDDQSHQAANLIQQILDFSRRSLLERHTTNLLPFCKELAKLWTRTLPENISVSLSHDQTEYIVNADPGRLQQALMNLAINARDAMPDGGRLDLTFTRLDLLPDQPRPMPDMTPGAWLRLTVADTGVGIAPELLHHIFEPFFTTKPPGKGTGLGLAQAYGIVRQHEGHIRVDSQQGQGAVFTLYLPLLAAHRPSLSPPPPSTLIGGNETVLLVEDNSSARVALQETLTDLGYQVLTAANGPAALEIFQQRWAEIDLVLSDMIMPGMSGLDLYQRLKEQAPAIRMIIITGYPLEDEGKQLLEQGIVAWLNKPITMEEIDAAVRQAFQV